MNWRGTRRVSPPADSVAVIGHITDQRQTFADRSALSIQRGVEKLAGGEVHLSVKLPSGDIKVWTRSNSQVQRLLAAVVFSVPSAHSGGQEDIPVHFTLARTLKVQGLVYAPYASDEPESELAAALVSQGVAAVRRLPPRGRHSDGALLVLTFEGHARPDHVVLLYQRLEVRPFVPYPLRCGRCQRYRHHARFCKQPVRCGRCAGPHLTEGCKAETLKCAACGEGHSVRDSVCPVWRAELVINRWMAVDGLTLAEARKRMDVPCPAPGRTEAGESDRCAQGGASAPRATRSGQNPADVGAPLATPPQLRPQQVDRVPRPTVQRPREDRGTGMTAESGLGAEGGSPTGAAGGALGPVNGVLTGQASPVSSLGRAVPLSGPTLRSPRTRLEQDVLEGWQVAVGRGRGHPVQVHNRWTPLEAEDQTLPPLPLAAVSVGCQTSPQCPHMSRVDAATQTDPPPQTEVGSQWEESFAIPSQKEARENIPSCSILSPGTKRDFETTLSSPARALPLVNTRPLSPQLSTSSDRSSRGSCSPRSPDQQGSRRPRAPSPYPHQQLHSPPRTRSRRDKIGK